MKKFYDKLLLVLGLLALLGGVALYLSKSGSAPDEGAKPAPQMGNNPYQTIPIPDPVVQEASWPEPGPQSSGEEWLYDVFTPPKIYIDLEGNFTAIPPKGVVAPVPFGIYLDKIGRKPYRVQIQGFSGDRNKPNECVLFIFDEERQLRFFIRPGQSDENAEIELLDFTIDTKIDANNNVDVKAVATILDRRTGETVKLVDGERLLDSEVHVILRSKQDPTVEVELTKEGTSFETPAGQFILKEINLEEQSVTVEKQATDEIEAETRVLTLPVMDQPKTTPSEAKPAEDTDAFSEDLNFDSIF